MALAAHPKDSKDPNLRRASITGGWVFLCCPPNRGHNLRRVFPNVIRGGEECLYSAAQRCSDKDLARELTEAYQDLEAACIERKLFIFGYKHFKQCKRRYVKALSRCFERGLERPTTAFRPKGFVHVNRKNLENELVDVDAKLNGDLSDEVRHYFEKKRKDLLEKLDPDYQPGLVSITLDNPDPPPRYW
jgi:hypothetical protein